MITATIAGLFEKNINVVIVTTPQFFCSLSGLFLSRIKRVPFILEIADIWSDSLKGTILSHGLFFRIVQSFETFVLEKSDALVVLTKGFKKEIIKKGVNGEKIFISRNGVNPMPKNSAVESNKLRNKLNINQKKVIGYVGAHGSAQGLSNVLKAAKILEEDNPDILFLFIGDGDEKINLQKLGKNLTNIIFLEAVKKNEIPNYLSLFNIGLAHLKDDEIFKNTIPSKIFEMMSGGLPILLVSPKGEASEIVIENKVGKWVPSGSPDLLALEISNMLKSEGVLKEFSINSLDKSFLFRRENQAKHMIDIVDKLLS
jgi:glycosyltransferase involved in cell wall biosynthesis